MNIEQEIRAQIEKNKGLKLAVGEINNHLSILEGLLRNERDDVQKQVNEAYQRGLDDAWEAARKIADMWETMDNDELLETFGVTARIGESVIRSLFKKQTANEAMLELESYEEKQKADDEIKVGDIVDWNGDKYIVSYINDDGRADLIYIECGSTCEMVSPDCLTRTGKHYDIEKILEGIKHD